MQKLRNSGNVIEGVQSKILYSEGYVYVNLIQSSQI
jgi:hypothetical protein